MKQIRILSVNTSEKKGTIKKPVDTILLDHLGIAGDAHSGIWQRQISLLGTESIDKMRQSAGRQLNYGDFAENITTQGFPLFGMRPLDRLIVGDIVLEVTQIGKKCHGSTCTIFKETGDCVMPREGIFCRVLHGGTLKAGDVLEYKPRVIQVKVITLSDRASRGDYEDKSGPLLKDLIVEYLTGEGWPSEIQQIVIADDAGQLKSLISKFTAMETDLVFTTGGTGIGPHDITPDVIKPMLDKEIPGIMEMIRFKYGMLIPNALVSRSLAGLISHTLIYVLPGSPKAVKEYAGEIFKTLEHSLMMLHEIDKHG